MQNIILILVYNVIPIFILWFLSSTPTLVCKDHQPWSKLFLPESIYTFLSLLLKTHWIVCPEWRILKFALSGDNRQHIYIYIHVYIYIHIYINIYIYIYIYIYVLEHNKWGINQVYQLERMINILRHNINWKTKQIATKLSKKLDVNF